MISSLICQAHALFASFALFKIDVCLQIKTQNQFLCLSMCSISKTNKLINCDGCDGSVLSKLSHYARAPSSIKNRHGSTSLCFKRKT
jgi:hypothetical protein